MRKYNGTVIGFKAAIAESGWQGKWTIERETGLYRFKAISGEVVTWWSRTGTLLFQGRNVDNFARIVRKELEEGGL